MKLLALLVFISITKIVGINHLSKANCLQKVESKAIFKGELRELDWKTSNEVKKYLQSYKIEFLKPGKTEIQIDLNNKEEYAIFDYRINHLSKLNKGDTVLIKGYRLECNENKYLIITKIN